MRSEGGASPSGGRAPARSGAGTFAARDVAWFSRTAALAVGAVAATEAIAVALGLFPRAAVPLTLAITAAMLAVGWAVAATGRAWPAIWIDVVAFAIIAIPGSAVFPLMFVTIVALPAATTVVTVPFLQGGRLWAMLAIVWAISIGGAAVGLVAWPPAGSDRAGTIAAVISLVVIGLVASWQLVRVSDAFRHDRDSALLAEAQYRALFEGSPAASIVFDTETMTVREVNAAAERLFGTGRDTLRGRMMADLVHPTAQAIYASRMDRMRTDEPIPVPAGVRMRRADGTPVEVEGASMPIRFDGRPARLTVLLDVTEQRRLADAAAEAAVRLEEAQSIAHVGSWSVDVGPSGLEDGMLTWSTEALRILGLPATTGPVPGSAFYALVHPDDVEVLRSASRAAESRGAAFELEHRIIRPDGQVRLVREHGRLVRDVDGRLLRHAGTIEDVTDRRELERRLAAAERLEAVGRLASGIAHDFNNLLTVIAGNAEIALMEIGPEGAARDPVEAIILATRRSATITGDLLTFTRRPRSDPRPVRLDEAVDALAPAIRDLVAPRATVVVTHDPEPAVVLIDRAALERIVVNLVVNARDAMTDRGTITLSTGRRVHGDGAGDGDVRAVLAVADTGSGMSPEVIARAFEPFYSTKRDTGPIASDGPLGGSGLGLSIVAGLVDEAGGRVELESVLGTGTTFRIILPLAGSREPAADARGPLVQAAGTAGVPAAATSLAVAAAPGSVAGSTAILLVEDDADVATFVASALRAAGYGVTVAASADEAWERFLARRGDVEDAPGAARVDVVVSDVVMPGMSGAELARRLAARHPPVPVVLMSAYAAEVDGMAAAAGPVTLLDKPFTVATLLAAVERAVASAG